MKKFDLGGTWSMRRADWDYNITAKVPGSICTDLMNAKLLCDPYYRNNSDLFEEAAEYDYIYKRSFEISEDKMQFKNIMLCCEGLDTLCDIYINNKKLAETDNMHTRFSFDIKNFICIGENEISIIIKSPLKYCRECNEKKPLAQVSNGQCREGFAYLRKAHCMLGWDWAPVIPDGGIWKNIFLSFDNGLQINSVFITQEHKEDGKVSINVLPEIKNEHQQIELVLEFDGKTYKNDGKDMHIEVENPRLWYPIGYGEQNLYNIKLTAFAGGEQDEYLCRIGLRKAEVITKKDKFGTSMYFSVNNIPIFAKGANYVIEDSIITRYSEARTRNLLTQAVKANHNTVRVWGGAIYPHDYFYNICDELGILVWQDFMFACAQYPNTEDFYNNISHEAEDNIKRLRNHASLIMWCGNNECETAVKNWWSLQEDALKDYRYQYEELLPKILSKNDPTRYYQPSSPTGNGNFDETESDSVRDSHYWDIWFHQKPLNEYFKYHFRFLSEFGFQAFPAIETIETFTKESDRNIFSKIMEYHQRSDEANGKILLYMAKDFKYPKNLDNLIYVSQILQAEGVRAGVEHMRRNRNENRCMGAIYWQLNDCWPVASWSGLDYFDRWKALQYSSKKFFADILLSALCYEKEKVLIALSNDRLESFFAEVYYAIKDRDGKELFKVKKDISVNPLSSENVFDIDTHGTEPENQYIEYGINNVMTGVILLCPNKYFEYENPEILYTIKNKNGKSYITLSCKSLANFLELKADNGDAKFSDNYFALSAGIEKEIECDRIIDTLSVRSIYDTF